MRQGDLFWVDFGEAQGSEPAYRRPIVVVQNDVFNSSRLRTVVVCLLTSNVRLATRPGNVLLNAGEGGLSQQSVVNVSQLYTVDRTQCDDYIGCLSPQRVREVVDGIRLVIEP